MIRGGFWHVSWQGVRPPFLELPPHDRDCVLCRRPEASPGKGCSTPLQGPFILRHGRLPRRLVDEGPVHARGVSSGLFRDAGKLASQGAFHSDGTPPRGQTGGRVNLWTLHCAQGKKMGVSRLDLTAAWATLFWRGGKRWPEAAGTRDIKRRHEQPTAWVEREKDTPTCPN
jgi:hypothetical protein